MAKKRKQNGRLRRNSETITRSNKEERTNRNEREEGKEI